MLYEYGDPRVKIKNLRRDGTVISDGGMDGMVIPVNEDTVLAYRVMWEIACRLSREEVAEYV